jgi:hypothetical protein
MAVRQELPGAHALHPWPSCEGDWEALVDCRACGLAMLRLFVRSASWVVRRVETIEFLDDRTVRRRMSVDYTSPAEAVTLVRPDGAAIRVLPLTVLRRKSLINFDLRDEEGRPLPLLGLRETQALTLGVVRAWAAATLANGRRNGSGGLVEAVERVLDDVVCGDQAEMQAAYDDLNRAEAGDLGRLGHDPQFRAVLGAFASSFVLFTTDEGEVGARRIVKFAYDEPLMLRYSTSSYQGHADGPCPPAPVHGEPEPVTYGKGARWLSKWKREPVLAGLGWTPTLIRFPVPAAELTASYHCEITAPPEVSIVEASLVAGLPNLFLAPDPEADERAWKASAEVPSGERRARRSRRRRRPSFDHFGGGDPTVDLHVVDVPFGSLSRAQVALQASTTGWLTTAMASTWLATATLVAALLASNPAGDVATSLLMSFAAAMVALIARPDPHRMVTRLLGLVRALAGVSAVLTLAGAIAFAFFSEEVATWCLAIFAAVSLVPLVCITQSWRAARRRLAREAVPWGERERALEHVRTSPWEQHEPDDEPVEDYHVEFARELDDSRYPYDEAVRRLGFDAPAIRIASSEGHRRRFPWDKAFTDAFQARLDRGV